MEAPLLPSSRRSLPSRLQLVRHPVMEGSPDNLPLDRSRFEPGTRERWALDYVLSDSLAYKLAPPSVPDCSAPGSPLRIASPGRPRELVVSWDKYKAPRTAAALRDARKRAGLLHTFFHHELQAAELMCWALLAFPDSPPALQRGLLNICLDEVRHMQLYAQHVHALGFALGSFPVRDWFWERAPAARSVLAFLALMGLGFEAGNLDHSERYTRLFGEAGDPQAAALQALVGHEERAHVAFAAHWFRTLSGGLDFASWCAALPAPLSPMVMRGRPLAREARLAAGLDASFLDALEAWQPA
jgi:uncharacterized ferritin-like protein (DUF455 family)